jgi:acetyl esterase/lipase
MADARQEQDPGEDTRTRDDRPPGRTRRTCAMTGALALGVALVALTAWFGAKPVRVLNALSAIGSHRTVTGLRYGEDDRQRLDLYQPADRVGPGAVPLVVFVYGGSWNRGERADYRFVGEALSARGVAVAIVDYRLYPRVTYPAFLQDVAQAVSYSLAHAAEWGADPRRVFVMGHSAGGYNAAMMALDPRWLAAAGRRPQALAGWIGLAGPYDFLPIQNPEVKPVFHAPDVAPDTQPLLHARAAAAPLPAFLAAPVADDLVNPERSTAQMARTLRERGGAVVERHYDGVDHLTIVGAFSSLLAGRAPVRDEVVAFIRATPPAGADAR